MAAGFSPQDSALYRQAVMLYERGDPVAALLFEQVLAATPGHVDARYKLANVRKEADQPYANLGRLLQSLGRTEEAVRVFVEAQSRGLNAGLFGHLLAAASGR